MVWAARGSGNHTRPFAPAQACLGAGATPAAGCLEGRLCVPASPTDRGSARRREVRSAGNGRLFTLGFEVRGAGRAGGSPRGFFCRFFFIV